jgi:hypothetical protein
LTRFLGFSHIVPPIRTEGTPMKELQVRSRIISSVYFDPGDGRLRILFKNGEVRLFDSVPESKAVEMVNSSSPGNYYLKHIRTRFRRLAA